VIGKLELFFDLGVVFSFSFGGARGLGQSTPLNQLYEDVFSPTFRLPVGELTGVWMLLFFG
jgi:hypothetical protein